MYTAFLLKRVAASAYIAFFVLSETDLAVERTRFHGGLVKKKSLLGKLILIWFEFEENVANENLLRTFFRM